MSATAPRTVSNAPDVRQLGVAVGALILAVALVVAVTVSRQAASTSTAPLAAPVPVVHDHGWSESVPFAGAAHDNGWATTDASAPILITRSTGAGTLYTGIPYTPSRSIDQIQGGRGTRIAR